MKIIEVNCETGEELIRDMTPEELADANERIEKALAQQTKAQTKEAARQAVLDRLGLTSEEARLLLG